jgi:hypothetical protein
MAKHTIGSWTIHILLQEYVRNDIFHQKRYLNVVSEVFYVLLLMGQALMPDSKQIELFLMKLGPKPLSILGNPLIVPTVSKKCCIWIEIGRNISEVMFFMFFFQWSRL